MITQFVNSVAWGDLDYLVIDTPPGTSDEHLAIVEALAPYTSTTAVIVTTPQVFGSAYESRYLITFWNSLLPSPMLKKRSTFAKRSVSRFQVSWKT